MSELSLVDTDPWLRNAGPILMSADIEKAFREHVPGIQFDWGVSPGSWHPNISEVLGVLYNDAHVGPLDRNEVPQWPVWEYKRDVIDVPLSRALRDDMPVLSLSAAGRAEVDGTNTAHVLTLVPERVFKRGWRDFFTRVLDFGLPGVDQQWIQQQFRISTDWYKPHFSWIRHSYLAERERARNG